jgi:hypothetical protein
MATNVPPQYGHQIQADADRVRQAQEFQKAQQEAAEAAKKAAEIAEQQRLAHEKAAADQANRIGWSGQQR